MLGGIMHMQNNNLTHISAIKEIKEVYLKWLGTTHMPFGN